jgi:hypothetical protein
MNHSIKAFAAKKLTKRERKEMNRERRAKVGAVSRSLKCGVKHKVSGTAYAGVNPAYTITAKYPGGPLHAVKVAKGVPFVRVAA